MDTIRVKRVEGKVYPDPRPGRDFVGLRKARMSEDDQVVYRVPGGFMYVDDGAQSLPNTREIRQAIADGDLVEVAPEPAAAAKSAAKPTGERPRRARRSKKGDAPPIDPPSPTPEAEPDESPTRREERHG